MTVRPVAAIAAALLFLGGCGSQESSEKSTSKVESEATPEPTAAAERTPAPPPEGTGDEGREDAPDAAAPVSGVDQSSLEEVAIEFDRRLIFEGPEAAWELLHPQCRPESYLAQLEKFGDAPQQMLDAMRAKGGPAAEAELRRQLEEKIETAPRKVLYDDDPNGDLVRLGTQRERSANFAEVTEFDPETDSNVGAQRYVKADGLWWVDVRTRSDTGFKCAR